MSGDTAYFMFNEDFRNRLLESPPFETYTDYGFLNYPVSTPRLKLIYDNKTEWQIVYSEKELTVQTKVEHLRLGTFISTCRFREDGGASVGYPKKIEDSFTTFSEKESFVRNFLHECDIVRRHFDVLQFAITHPERIFKKNRNGKHILNSAPKTGDDERLYRRIKAFRSLVTETKATGKGHSHRHEYDVKGHYRHYKNGKIVYVKSYTCCKGRGAKNIHIYEA